MSREYYYFAASLPLLEFDSKPFMNLETFLSECERLLDRQDFLLIKNVLREASLEDSKNTFVNAWHLFEKRFTNEMVYFRAARWHQDPNEHMKGERAFDPHLAEIIQQAIKNTDLLAAEKMIDKVRWSFLDELLAGHYFDIEMIIGYALKLKILERYQLFSSDIGLQRFQQYQHISLPEEIQA
ncbi:MAG TPA: DUF2764 family protein [Candidatus Omnitrophota bacterium]|nr:DUF2764 family protein [Candidatus Omnitrophota bacterium]HPN87803.1 DUF2764 family protein [Candidatus Omnitrophota bacterium]